MNNIQEISPVLTSNNTQHQNLLSTEYSPTKNSLFPLNQTLQTFQSPPQFLKKKRLNRSSVWSESEDQLLLEIGKTKRSQKWSQISKIFPQKTSAQCRARYDRIKKEHKRGPWTPAEDQKVKELYKIYGPKWSTISKHMKLRTGKQIRDRYINKIDTKLNQSKFTQEEDETILKWYLIYGNVWSKIALKLKGRSGDMVKNRFYSKLKKCILKFNSEPNSSNNNLSIDKNKNILNSIKNVKYDKKDKKNDNNNDFNMKKKIFTINKNKNDDTDNNDNIMKLLFKVQRKRKRKIRKKKFIEKFIYNKRKIIRFKTIRCENKRTLFKSKLYLKEEKTQKQEHLQKEQQKELNNVQNINNNNAMSEKNNPKKDSYLINKIDFFKENRILRNIKFYFGYFGPIMITHNYFPYIPILFSLRDNNF